MRVRSRAGHMSSRGGPVSTKLNAPANQSRSEGSDERPLAEVVSLAPRRRPGPRPVPALSRDGEDDPDPGPSAA